MTGILDDLPSVKCAACIPGADVELRWLTAFFIHVDRAWRGLNLDSADVLPCNLMERERVETRCRFQELLNELGSQPVFERVAGIGLLEQAIVPLQADHFALIVDADK